MWECSEQITRASFISLVKGKIIEDQRLAMTHTNIDKLEHGILCHQVILVQNNSLLLRELFIYQIRKIYWNK